MRSGLEAQVLSAFGGFAVLFASLAPAAEPSADEALPVVCPAIVADDYTYRYGRSSARWPVELVVVGTLTNLGKDESLADTRWSPTIDKWLGVAVAPLGLWIHALPDLKKVQRFSIADPTHHSYDGRAWLSRPTAAVTPPSAVAGCSSSTPRPDGTRTSTALSTYTTRRRGD